MILALFSLPPPPPLFLWKKHTNRVWKMASPLGCSKRPGWVTPSQHPPPHVPQREAVAEVNGPSAAEIKLGEPAVPGGRTGDSGVCRAEAALLRPRRPPPPPLAFETAAQSCSISQQICQVCSGGILQIPSDPELFFLLTQGSNFRVNNASTKEGERNIRGGVWHTSVA